MFVSCNQHGEDGKKINDQFFLTFFYVFGSLHDNNNNKVYEPEPDL